ncbi:sulfatase-like hydrolase/transferase [Patescibacteria group bacterium AH-259-L07]|nr:sulfatase-like hydrolase/transferase [Patescibacteria group bacterium AH-259-L07]
MKYGLHGIDFREYAELILGSIVFLLVGAGFSIWLVFKQKVKNNHKRIQTNLVLLFLFGSLLLNPVTTRLDEFVFENNEKLVFDKNSEFYKFYKHPELKQIAKAKSLVFIYAESIERTYLDETIFPNLTENLQKLESKSISFTNIIQDVNSSYTIAGMVAGQCGFPLMIPTSNAMYGNSMFGMDTYLEAATCLGDLLHKEGYYLSYYGGASLSFGGKGKFFSTHKFNEVKGRDELLYKLQNQGYRNTWGLYDDSLFDLAYNRYLELSKKQDKFAMFLLTLDTHPSPSGGHPSKTCNDIKYQDGKNSMLNTVACSDYLISNFINKIRQSERSDETVIVVASDSLGLKSASTRLLNKGDRKNLFLINEPDSLKGIVIDKPGLIFDIASTVLPFIGYEGDIGLGKDIIKTEASEFRVKNILNSSDKFKPYILRFWKFPKIEKSIEINTAQEKLFIDNREFSVPILVKLNDQLETTLNFGFFTSDEMALIDAVSSLDKNTPFLLIEECYKVNEIVNTKIDYHSLCLLAGKDGKYSYMNLTPKINLTDGKYSYYMRSTPKIKLSTKEIRKITKGFPLSKANDNLEKNKFLVRRIAHAGGGINGRTYTNSIEALNNNIKKGFSYFEIDFVFTKDGHLVCLHDWDSDFENIFGFKTEQRLTLNEFKQLVSKESKFRNCTLSELADWMDKHPDSYLITDMKENNIKALEIISGIIPDYKKRVIPQIYFPENFDKVKKIGYNQIIWTLYRYGGTNEGVLTALGQFHGPFAITMPKERARSILPLKLSGMEIPTYVHIVNSIEEKTEFLEGYNITEIYTDFLSP